MRFTAISTLYLISPKAYHLHKEVHGGKGLHHVMTGEVSQYQLSIPLPHVFVRISPYPCAYLILLHHAQTLTSHERLGIGWDSA